MSADKDRAIRRQKQKRAKQARKRTGQSSAPVGGAPTTPPNGPPQPAA